MIVLVEEVSDFTCSKSVDTVILKVSSYMEKALVTKWQEKTRVLEFLDEAEGSVSLPG